MNSHEEAQRDTKKKSDINTLCDRIRQTAYAIHCHHKHGHLEKVYENALAHRLKKLGLTIEQQHPLSVYDEDGTVVGEYFADLLVNNSVIVELKACDNICTAHIAQLLGYLRSSKMKTGLLLNFGAPRFYIKKFIMD